MNKLVKERKKWFDWLAKLGTLEYSVVRNGKFGRWKVYQGEVIDAESVHRSRLSCEVIFDIDGVNIEHSGYIANKILTKLEDMSLKYYACYTGGKGIHIHLFVTDKAQELYEYVLSSIRPLDKYIDKQVMSSRHLIRAEGSKNEKSGLLKTVFVSNGAKLGEYMPLKVSINNLSGFVFRKPKTQVRTENNAESRPEILQLTYLMKFRDIVEQIIELTAELQDGRKRACFVIACYLHKSGIDKKSAEKYLNYINETRWNSEIKKSSIKSTVESVYNYNPVEAAGIRKAIELIRELRSYCLPNLPKELRNNNAKGST